MQEIGATPVIILIPFGNTLITPAAPRGVVEFSIRVDWYIGSSNHQPILDKMAARSGKSTFSKANRASGQATLWNMDIHSTLEPIKTQLDWGVED